MEDLKIHCDADDKDLLSISGDKYNAHLRTINVLGRDRVSTCVSLSTESARQLHEWLGRYLENANG